MTDEKTTIKLDYKIYELLNEIADEDGISVEELLTKWAVQERNKRDRAWLNIHCTPQEQEDAIRAYAALHHIPETKLYTLRTPSQTREAIAWYHTLQIRHIQGKY